MHPLMNVFILAEVLHRRMDLSTDDPRCLRTYNNLTLVSTGSYKPDRWVATFDFVDTADDELWYERGSNENVKKYPTRFFAASAEEAVAGAIELLLAKEDIKLHEIIEEIEVNQEELSAALREISPEKLDQLLKTVLKTKPSPRKERNSTHDGYEN